MNSGVVVSGKGSRPVLGFYRVVIRETLILKRINEDNGL